MHLASKYTYMVLVGGFQMEGNGTEREGEKRHRGELFPLRVCAQRSEVKLEASRTARKTEIAEKPEWSPTLLCVSCLEVGL